MGGWFCFSVEGSGLLCEAGQLLGRGFQGDCRNVRGHPLAITTGTDGEAPRRAQVRSCVGVVLVASQHQALLDYDARKSASGEIHDQTVLRWDVGRGGVKARASFVNGKLGVRSAQIGIVKQTEPEASAEQMLVVGASGGFIGTGG